MLLERSDGSVSSAVSNGGRDATASRALEEAIRAIPLSWFQPSPAIYWTDMLLSAAIGWAAFIGAVKWQGWLRTTAVAVAVAALYRAVLFIHEITHRPRRDLPGFTLVWNALVGVPLMIPSFMYEGVHIDHHRARSYGTLADPEYVPFGHRSPLLIAGFILGSIAAPFAFALRFAVLAPISWLVPAIRRWVGEHASALVINHAYIRRTPLERVHRVQEAASCAVVWTAAWLWWTERLPTSVWWFWAVASASAFAINSIRTLAAHLYDRDSGELSMLEQLLDSCTLQPGRRILRGRAAQLVDAVQIVIAPVGLRYHALHHWIPSLPYHRLGRTHRLLVATLNGDAPYRATILPGLIPALSGLLRRSSRDILPRTS
jgi:fatty acid desaturase